MSKKVKGLIAFLATVSALAIAIAAVYAQGIPQPPDIPARRLAETAWVQAMLNATAIAGHISATAPGATVAPTATYAPGATATAAPTIAPTATASATAVVTATVVPSATATAMPGHSADIHCHAPGAHGDRPAHEHGDCAETAAPWLIQAGITPTFDHVGGTPGENHLYWKHTAFKGWAGTFGAQRWYGIFHLDFNPGGHVSRYHSYQLWIEDQTGAISHLSGWLDFGTGDETFPNVKPQCDGGGDERPIMTPPCITQGEQFGFESWYSLAGSSLIDAGFNVNPNFYSGGDFADPSTWQNTGYVRNLERRIEWAWYADRTDQRGEFYTTQFFDVVSGPNDPACGTLREIGLRTYTVACLRQFIAPTLQQVSFPDNAVQRIFPGEGVVTFPN